MSSDAKAAGPPRVAVSVVMPVRNGMPFLPDAIDSIRQQTFTDLELIVVDDHSDDETRSVLERYAAMDSRIRPVAAEGRGISSALNQGIALASGRYLARMDADDWSEPTRLASQVQFLDDQPHYVAVGSEASTIDSDGHTTGMLTSVPVIGSVAEGARLGVILLHPTACARMDAVRRVGGYRSFFDGAEDYDLWLRMLTLGPLANLQEPLLAYRLHEGQHSGLRPDQGRLATFVAAYLAAGPHSAADFPLAGSLAEAATAALWACMRDPSTRGIFPLARLVKVARRAARLEPGCRPEIRQIMNGILRTAMREADYGAVPRSVLELVRS